MQWLMLMVDSLSVRLVTGAHCAVFDVNGGFFVSEASHWSSLCCV